MPRQATPLTDSALKVAKPKAKPYKLNDGQGLYLEVMPSGSKLWRLKFRFAGKENRMSLGAYPTVPLQQARRKRDEARQVLAGGKDPSAERQAEKAALQSNELTFETLAREWHAYLTPRWAKATADKANAYLESDILPALGHRPAKAITRPEVVALIRKIEARGAFNVAKKTRHWLSQIFRFGLAQGSVESNPATDLDVIAAQAPATIGHPRVSFAELPELLSRVDNAKINTLTRHAIRLLVLTAVRPGELRGARWSEFELDDDLWTIPKERMKARRNHQVPLPRQAVAILRELQEITGSYDLVFPGRNNTDRPMSENTINKALADAGYKGRQTGHGFRHMLSTELNERSYKEDWIERQLAHGSDDEIRETYNHASYLPQREIMMQEWADSIDALCAAVNMAKIDHSINPHKNTQN
ncbi:MAG: tyrosine-type recombinase/integrase [Gammaproteobacteria bacterium]|uniref:Putative site-specific tyrosine recombinase n=1 Tax=viral metagenome TaxID=1070528 RepID=A0A6M3MAM9_9ZZZZ|nr:tyrosine-type recombinase/integrase [Gammaproteobacteria bacterium]MBU0883263.1 tyrosine-type recombinase/integrase [Gammaproteobacteria bacterium]MBU1858784.1 tyrosine-type recombinase/integrase [Gammaproteobacteria bacterium]